jgi:hypothetical protein
MLAFLMFHVELCETSTWKQLDRNDPRGNTSANEDLSTAKRQLFFNCSITAHITKIFITYIQFLCISLSTLPVFFCQLRSTLVLTRRMSPSHKTNTQKYICYEDKSMFVYLRCSGDKKAVI